MAPGTVLRGLCELAERAGVEVRIEPFEPRPGDLRTKGPRGGLCRIRGRVVVLVDAKLALVDQIGVVGEALGRIELDEAPPEALASYLRTGHGNVRVSLLRPRPLARTRLLRCV